MLNFDSKRLVIYVIDVFFPSQHKTSL